jgi:hypothetical protein
MLGTGPGAAQSELVWLEESVLILARRTGHQKCYEATQRHRCIRSSEVSC